MVGAPTGIALMGIPNVTIGGIFPPIAVSVQIAGDNSDIAWDVLAGMVIDIVAIVAEIIPVVFRRSSLNRIRARLVGNIDILAHAKNRTALRTLDFDSSPPHAQFDVASDADSKFARSMGGNRRHGRVDLIFRIFVGECQRCQTIVKLDFGELAVVIAVHRLERRNCSRTQSQPATVVELNLRP